MSDNLYTRKRDKVGGEVLSETCESCDWCVVLWCGVLCRTRDWYDVMWYHVVWCDVVWNGVVKCDYIR